jgi:signal transduction histidine kinase
MIAAGAMTPPQTGESNSHLIYVVDDDPLALTSLERLLELETPHRVRCFNSGGAALEAIREQTPDLIISDLTMPGMDGLELLRQVRALHPDTVRIVLTGYADKESAIRAINDAEIFQYVEKPWDNEVLLIAVNKGLEHRGLTRALTQTVTDLRARNAELEHTIRELRNAQERLVASERLAAVGRLASGIAHEIGNQLSLLSYAELLAERYAGDPDARELTEPLIAAKRRLNTLVASIREFVRGGGGSTYLREGMELAPLVDEALSILRFEPAIKLRRVERTPFDTTTAAVVNREKLVQVLINLLRNAIQATSERGRIRIGVQTVGSLAVIDVEDDGTGILPENVDRIWEPFFSTRGEGGTGLGLAISKRILEEHGGSIHVRSQPGHGATFTVELPAA